METCLGCGMNLNHDEGAVVPPIALKVARKQEFFNTEIAWTWRKNGLDYDRRCRLCASCFQIIYPYIPAENPNVVKPDMKTARLIADISQVRDDYMPPTSNWKNDQLITLGAAPGQSSYATAACLLGPLSLFLFPFAPLALLLGILALRDIRRHPEKTGTSRAWLGIVTGALVTLILLALGIALLVAYHYQMFDPGS